jgi:hypothetical protein
MFWNRNHSQKRHGLARPSFRPQLECLEARTLPDASGPVTAALATLARDLGQAVNDAAHLQGSAVQKDATKISQDASNVITQVRNSPGGNLLIDFIAVARGLSTMQTGLVAIEAGVAASAEPGGVALGAPVAMAGVIIFDKGLDLTTTGAEQFIKDLGSLNSGGQQQQQQQQPLPIPTPSPTPNAPSVVGTWSASLVPGQVVGNVDANAPQKVTLTLNADGSGSLSISPFAGTPLRVNFPAGAAQMDDSGATIEGYVSPTGYVIGASVGVNGNVLLQGNFYAVNNNTDDAAYFYSASLNRQL